MNLKNASKTSYNKAYVLHSLAVVRAAPHRAKDRATSHKQDVMGKLNKRNNRMTQTREPPIFDTS